MPTLAAFVLIGLTAAGLLSMAPAERRHQLADRITAHLAAPLHTVLR